MADNQTLLTDQEIQDIADGFDIHGARPEFARAIASAVLSKLHVAGEPSDDDILRTFNEACEYADRCGQGFSYGRVQALRAVISRYAAPRVSAEESAIDRPIPDSVEHYGLIDERVGAPAAEPEWIDDPHDIEQDLWAVAESVVVEWQKAGKMPPMAWDFREFLIAGMRAYALADRQQRGGDVGECSFSDLIDAYTDAVRNGNFSERVAARAELMNSYRQQRAQPVTSDAEIDTAWRAYQLGRNKTDSNAKEAFANALRGYAAMLQPVASAEPVAWVAADTLNSPHPRCVSSLAYMSQIDQDRGREYVPLYAAPVAAHNTGGGGTDAAIAAIRFALEADDGMAWLRCWNEGDFDACRNEWPETPEECFIGADPLHPSTRAILAAQPAASPPPSSRTGG